MLPIGVIGLLVRVSLFDHGVHGYDSYALREWTWALVQQPLSAFYAQDLEVPPDHLPGDLWVMFSLGWITWQFLPGFNFYSASYIDVLKMVPTVADLGIVLVLYVISRRFIADRQALLIAVGYALNPASMVLTGVWGQWDSLSILLALMAVGAMLSGHVTRSMIALTLACLVKPQFGLLLPLLGLFWLRSISPESRGPGLIHACAALGAHWRRLVGTITAMAATVWLICWPFGVSLTGRVTEWSILARIRFAVDRYPATTLGANNIWIIPIGRGVPPDDHTSLIAGVSYQAVGSLLLGTCLVLGCVAVLRMPRPAEALVWSATFVMMGAFLVSTRMHERYMFPVVVFALLLCAFGRRFVPIAIGCTALVFANVYLSLSWGWGDGRSDVTPIPVLDNNLTPRALAFVTVLLFASLARQGLTTLQAVKRQKAHAPAHVDDSRVSDVLGLGPSEAGLPASADGVFIPRA